jgi:hypothetical protein
VADEFVRKLAGFSLATACAFLTAANTSAANTSAAFSASGVSAAAGSSLGFSPGEGFAPAAGASTVAGTSTSNVLPPMATKAPMLPRTRSNGSGGGARLTSWLLPCSGLLPDPPAAAIAARVWSKSGPRPWAPSYHGVRDNQLPPRRPHREAFGLRYSSLSVDRSQPWRRARRSRSYIFLQASSVQRGSCPPSREARAERGRLGNAAARSRVRPIVAPSRYPH